MLIVYNLIRVYFKKNKSGGRQFDFFAGIKLQKELYLYGCYHGLIFWHIIHLLSIFWTSYPATINLNNVVIL